MGSVIGSVIGAGASIIGANKQAKAAKSAAAAQERSAAEATELQREQFNRVRQDFDPYRQMGQQANPALMQYVLGGDQAYYQNALGQQTQGDVTGATGAMGFDEWSAANPQESQQISPDAYTDWGESSDNPFTGRKWQGSQPPQPLGTSQQPATQTGRQAEYEAYVAGQQPTPNADGTAPQGPTGGMSPDLQRSQDFVDQMGGLNSQFDVGDFGTGQLALEGMPGTDVGQQFQTPQVQQDFTQGQVQQDFTPGQIQQDFSSGQVAPTIDPNDPNAQYNQQFTEQQVDPSINVDLEALENDPLTQYLRDQRRKGTLRELSSEGMVGSSAGIDRVTGADMGVLASEIDRRLARQTQENQRRVGNEQRLFQSQGAQANLGLANIGNALQNRQAAFGQGESNAARQLQQQQLQYGQSADNAARQFQQQQAQYGQGADNAARQFAAQQAQGNLGLANAGMDMQGQQLQYGQDTDAYNRQLQQAGMQYDVGASNYDRGRQNALLAQQTDVDNYGRQYGNLQNQASMSNQLGQQQYGRLMDLSGIGQSAAGQVANAGQSYANNVGGIAQSQANALGTIGAANANAQAQNYQNIAGSIGTGLSAWANQPQASSVGQTPAYNPNGYQATNWMGR